MIEGIARVSLARVTGTREEPRTTVRRTADERARLGDEIYERDIRPQLGEANEGDYVAIDVDSGSWTIGSSIRAATESLRTQRPDAVDVWTVRVGFRALRHFGGRPLRRSP